MNIKEKEDVRKMSDTKLRFMVAMAARVAAMEEKFDPLEMWDGQEVSMDAAMDGRCVPDYPRSLDAMHEVEKTLTEKQKTTYLTYLGEKVVRDGANHGWCWGFATARQRAEVFVLTMEKGNKDKKD